MSLVVTKGYLIGRYNYSTFDEILIFLNNFGNKFTCIALGTRKISSKNSRALFFGNYLEIEMFYSNINKLAKLKKVVAINQIGFEYSSNLAFFTINDILSNMKELNKNWYSFYQDIIVKVLMNYDQYELSVYIYLIFIQKIFKKINLIKCNHPISRTKFGYSFVKKGFVCTTCFPTIKSLDKDELEIFKDIFNNNKDINNVFFCKKYNVNWKNFYLKLHYSFNELINKINYSYKLKRDSNEKRSNYSRNNS